MLFMTLPTIFATRFREKNIGRIVSQTKVRTEYCLLINYKHEVTIEITNSRFSRKKAIRLNGTLVDRFTRTSTSGLRHSWSYPLDGCTLVFSTTPNSNASGTDLKINGKDFFEYVYQLGTDETNGRKKSSLETVLLFRVPQVDAELSSPPTNFRPPLHEYRPINQNSPNIAHDQKKTDTSGEYASLDELEESSD